MSRGSGEDRDLAECFISVDVETGGATPADYALLSIGACLVDDPETTFYVELKPEDKRSTQEALEVSKLSLDILETMGEPPAEAMQHFADWVGDVVPEGHRPIFVGFNAPFDWMFVADYFERYVGRNPFGYTALDIKAFAMGRLGSTWAETSMSVLGPKYLSGRPLAHHALSDAQDQAALFRALYAEPAHRRKDTAMTDTTAAGSGDDVARLVESAQRLGIELDAADTERWLAAMTREEGVETSDIVIDEKDGVFGHRVSMLDFSPRDLARFRRIGEVVEVTGPEGVAEGALALSGSAAQSKIQTHPGDADFFQRLNIKAADPRRGVLDPRER